MRKKMAQNNQPGGRIFIGAILIIVGGLFLLRNFNFIDFDFAHVLFSFPSVLIFVGVLSVLNSTKKWFGIVLIVVGGAMHLSQYYDIDFSAFILPIILIGLGFMILVKHNRPKPIMPDLSSHALGLDEEVRDDKLEVISIFGGSSKFFISDAFKGGNITSIFGGNEINLSGCKLAEGENIIDVVAIFGGTTIFIPKEWNVIIDVFPIFGGFGTKGKRDPMMAVEKDRVLRIKGIVVFGGGEIKLV
jgi:predicted membrane protein